MPLETLQSKVSKRQKVDKWKKGKMHNLHKLKIVTFASIIYAHVIIDVELISLLKQIYMQVIPNKVSKNRHMKKGEICTICINKK